MQLNEYTDDSERVDTIKQMMISRRGILNATATTLAVTAGSGMVAGQEAAVTFEFGGATRGWQARAPESISGATNPTLTLQPGTTYRFKWENVDGQPHNVVIVDGEGNQLERTELITEGTQTLTFTATAEMSEYYCEAHPTSMRGSISISGEEGGAGTTNSTNGQGWQPYTNDSEEAAYANESTIRTEPPTSTATATKTPESTAAPTDAPTTTTTEGTNETTTEGPGMGLLSGVAGFVGTVGYLLRGDRRDEE